jgi:hypothetical protein
MVPDVTHVILDVTEACLGARAEPEPDGTLGLCLFR